MLHITQETNINNAHKSQQTQMQQPEVKKKIRYFQTYIITDLYELIIDKSIRNLANLCEAHW